MGIFFPPFLCVYCVNSITVSGPIGWRWLLQLLFEVYLFQFKEK